MSFFLIPLMSIMILIVESDPIVPFSRQLSYERIQSNQKPITSSAIFIEPVVGRFEQNDLNIITPLLKSHALSDNDLIGSDSIQMESIDRSQQKMNNKKFGKAFGSEFTDAFSSFGKAFGSGFGPEFGKGFNNNNGNNKFGKGFKSKDNRSMFGRIGKEFKQKQSNLGLKLKPFTKIFG